MSSFEGLYDIREMQPGDKHFILATFLRGVYYGNSWFTLIPKNIFMANYKKVAEHMVSSPNFIVNIACLKDDPSVIIGYSILSANGEIIHWVFVKSMWRKNGVAKSLLPTAPIAVSHLSTIGKTLMTKLPNVIFNPFAI